VKEDRLVMNSINIHEIGHSYFGDCLVVRRERRDMGSSVQNPGGSVKGESLLRIPLVAAHATSLEDFQQVPFGPHIIPYPTLQIQHFEHAFLKESWATYIECCWLEDTEGQDTFLFQVRKSGRGGAVGRLRCRRWAKALAFWFIKLF
jgi:hypothetical protein